MKYALLLLMLSLLGTHSLAQDTSTTTAAATTDSAASVTPVEPVDDALASDPSTVETKKGDPQIIKMIEEKYNLSAEDIAKYRAEKLGYGQIMLMAQFSKASGKSMDEVVALLKEKKSIRAVANELKLTKEDMKKINQEMKPLREARKERKEKAKEMKEARKEKREERSAERREERKERKERRGARQQK